MIACPCLSIVILNTRSSVSTSTYRTSITLPRSALAPLIRRSTRLRVAPRAPARSSRCCSVARAPTSTAAGGSATTCRADRVDRLPPENPGGHPEPGTRLGLSTTSSIDRYGPGQRHEPAGRWVEQRELLVVAPSSICPLVGLHSALIAQLRPRPGVSPQCQRRERYPQRLEPQRVREALAQPAVADRHAVAHPWQQR